MEMSMMDWAALEVEGMSKRSSLVDKTRRRAFLTSFDCESHGVCYTRKYFSHTRLSGNAAQPPKQTGPFELTLRFRFNMSMSIHPSFPLLFFSNISCLIIFFVLNAATVMLQIPSDKTSLADMRPVLLHAVNSTNALAPAPQLGIDVDENDAPEQAPTVKDCKFYRLDSSGRDWKAIDNDKASISGQGFKRDDVVAVSFPDDQGASTFRKQKTIVTPSAKLIFVSAAGKYSEPTVEPFEGQEAS